MKGWIAFVVVWGMTGSLIAQVGEESKSDVPAALAFTMKSIDGEDIDLSKYQGKVVVVVNVASRCGYTPQYAQLQALYETYGDRGLVVLGFPCNQFRGQEPGSNEQIKAFCSTNFGVTFDLFSKIDVNGDQRCELYQHLTSLDVPPQGSGDISWNFEKFILNRDGVPVARFKAAVRPDSPEFIEVIEKALK